MVFACSAVGYEARAARYRDTSHLRKFTPLRPYRRPVPRVLGGWAFFYGRGSTVLSTRPPSVALAAVARQTGNVRRASHRRKACFDASTNALSLLPDPAPSPQSPTKNSASSTAWHQAKDTTSRRSRPTHSPACPIQKARRRDRSLPTHAWDASSALAGTDPSFERYPTAPCHPRFRWTGASTKCRRGSVWIGVIPRRI